MIQTNVYHMVINQYQTRRFALIFHFHIILDKKMEKKSIRRSEQKMKNQKTYDSSVQYCSKLLK